MFRSHTGLYDPTEMGVPRNEVQDLERILSNPDADPIKISYETIRHITKNFAQEIGQGGFAVVYLGGLSNGMVAVKKLRLTSTNDSDQVFWDEVTCLERLKHKNIVQFLGYCEHEQAVLMKVGGKEAIVPVKEKFICFEYVPNGSLHDYLKEKAHGDISEWDQYYQIIKGICEGLNYLHLQLIYHMDLKPANVLMDAQMEPKITDFGLSRCVDEEESVIVTTSRNGTLGYMAPEFINEGEISNKSDIYAFGSIMMKILTLYHPDIEENWQETVDVDCPQMKQCIEIAQSCTIEDPDKRPTIVELVAKLAETNMMIDNELPILKEPRSVTHSSSYQVVEKFKALMSSETLGENFSINDIDTELNDLDSILEGNKKPSKLSYKLLCFITENFAQELTIGNGGFPKIYKGIIQRDAKHGSGCIAVKRLLGSQGIDDWRFYQEVKAVTMAQHRNIVQFLGHCSYTEEKKVEYQGKIVMAEMRERLLCFEYLSKGSLDNYLSDASRGFEWRERYQIIKGICTGLHYLHGKRIVHLDLKPQNILLDDNMVPKIADFGLAMCFGNAQTQGFITIITGTRGYIPPETYDQFLITLKADIYSLGVVIAEILMGHREISLENVLENWRYREGTSETLLEQIRACAEISIACMDEDPSKRPDTERIMELLVASGHEDGSIERGVSSIGTEEQNMRQPRLRPPSALPPRFPS